MHEIDLILTLTGSLAAALIGGYVTFRLGLSPIVGYLLAGFAVGPNTPGFVADMELAGPYRRLRSNFIDGVKEMPVRFTPGG